jgi:hypothetical protein
VTIVVGAGTGSLTPLECAHCRAPVVGSYCSNCGRPAGARRDLSVKHFLREAVLAVTDVDSALIGSFRALLLRPGQLTLEYLRGDRHRYLAPFRVFLLCNVLYFVAVAQFHVTVLTAPLAVQLDEMSYKTASRGIMIRRYPALVQRATPGQQARSAAMRASITTKYDGVTEEIGKLIVVVLIPFYALVLLALFIGTKRYFAEHLIFATHLVALFLIIIPASGLALSGLLMLAQLVTHARMPESEELYAGSMILWFSAYAFVAQRVVYGAGRLATSVRTVLLAATVVPIIVAFKFVLFLATLYWIA